MAIYAFLKGLFPAAKNSNFKEGISLETWRGSGYKEGHFTIHPRSLTVRPWKNGWKGRRSGFLLGPPLSLFRGKVAVKLRAGFFVEKLDPVGSKNILGDTTPFILPKILQQKTTQKARICWRCGVFPKKKTKNFPWSRSVVIECYGL